MKIGVNETNDRVFVIAEIGNNHEGSLDLAVELVGRAAEAGADAAKFQTIDPVQLVSADQSARIQQLQRLCLGRDDFEKLARVAAEYAVEFLSTPFDLESVAFLADLVPAYKIASSDNTFWPLIEAIAKTGKPILLSTGLADLEDLRQALSRIEAVWRTQGVEQEAALLHCVSSYPTPAEQANLGAIRTLREAFGVTVGYSDHTLGIEAAVLAVASGARVVEKHFTIDKNYSNFRDHQLSAEPGEFAEMVARIREAETLLGDGCKTPRDCEAEAKTALRRSIAAKRHLPAGTVLDWGDFAWVRPGSGLAPGEEPRLLGHALAVSVGPGVLITPEMLKD